MNELTVILPTLNEAGNIKKLSEEIWKYVPGTFIIVADDGSTDGTQNIVKKMMADLRPIKLIARSGKPCLTDSIWQGITESRTPYVAWMDADLSHPPELLPKLFEKARQTGCSIASRFAPGGAQKKASKDTPDSVFAVFLSVVVNFFVRKWLRLSITDYTSGFIVCRRDLIAEHKLVGDYGEYFIELMYFLSRSQVNVIEVPYVSPPRVWGESKTGASLPLLFKRGIKYLWITLKLVLPKGLFGNLSLARVRRNNLKN